MYHQRYIEKKAKGVVSVRKNAEILEIVSKQFDPETGVDIGERVNRVSISYLEAEKAILLRELDNINALIADLKALGGAT